MRITVLGGSPKGETSVTMQYVHYLEKRFPDHEWKVVQIASRIAKLERESAALEEVLESVKSADLVLWAFPLYFMTVCSQYKRFIELVDERSLRSAFSGKYAASLSTSIRFYDHAAHVYIREVSEDWDMRFIAPYSCAMNDLTKKAERVRLDAFAEDLFAVAAAGLPCPRRSAPLPVTAERQTSAAALGSLPPPPPPAGGQSAAGLKSVVLVDYPDSAAGRMADRAALSLGPSADRVDLGTLGLEHGCLGCLKCGAGDCAYTGKDAYIETYRDRVRTADIVVIAALAKDRWLSSRWKAFFDRSFFNTHRRTLMGKRVVILVSGPLSRLANMQETLSAIYEWQGAHLVDIVSDEVPTGAALASLIDAAAARAVRSALEARAAGPAPEATVPAATFRAVGGMKIFRDEVYGGLKLVFKADHREYKKTGAYDFPLKNPVLRFAVWLGYWITSIPFIRNGMRSNMKTFMLKPYEAVLNRTTPKRG